MEGAKEARGEEAGGRSKRQEARASLTSLKPPSLRLLLPALAMA